MRKFLVLFVLPLATQALPTLPPPAIFQCAGPLSPIIQVANSAIGGPINNPLVDKQPPWIKASVLLSSGNNLSRPRLPVVSTSTASDAELQKQSDAVTRVYKLRQEQKRFWLMVRERQQDLAGTTTQSQMTSNDQQATRKKIQDLAKQVADLREASWSCRIGIYCSAEIKTAQNNLDEAKAADLQLTAASTQAQQASLLKQKKLADATQAFVDETLKLNNQDVGANSEKDLQPGVIDRELERLQTEMQSLSVFVPLEPDRRVGSLKTCSIPLRYHLAPQLGDATGKNPLMDRLNNPELQPNEVAELDVCVNRANQVQSIHFLQDNREILSGTINANSHGEVTRIRVRNGAGKILEEREWTTLPTGKIRFKNSFYPTEEPSGKPIVQYQDQDPLGK